MLDWLKQTLNRLPTPVGNILLHNTLTGVRPSENLLCIKLVQTDYDNYANEELGILQHFRYSEFVCKKTKKAYLTVYDDSILQIALNCKVYNTWKAFRSKLKRCEINAVHTKYCRAIYATWLRKSGIEQEIISLYQGRVPNTVFQASYLKTNVREDRERILKALYQLKQCIEG
jgi:intergrase/recombinase